MTVIVVLGILAVASGFSVYAATPSNEPSFSEETITLCSYQHVANFDYIAYLINNTVYNKTALLPGEETIFKKITDHINATFVYNFMCSCNYTLTGEYKLIAQVHTNLWEKEYELVPKTNFQTDDFQIDFPINLTRYENIVSTIDGEIGIAAQDPVLNITCEIYLTIQTDKGTRYEYFTPQLSIPLNKNTVEIDGDLTQTKINTITDTVEVPALGEETNGFGNSLTSAAIFLVPLIPFAIFTKNDYSEPTELEKQIQKIKKKYGEWIVEINKPPKMPIGVETIHIKSLDDLIKASEELGKPIIYYVNDKDHTFFVMDDAVHYEFILK